MEKFAIPKEVLAVSNTLEKAGFEAYLVGGVRTAVGRYGVFRRCV